MRSSTDRTTASYEGRTRTRAGLVARSGVTTFDPDRSTKMKPTSGVTLSPWVATGEIALRPKLVENVTANVCVVGAGIAGMTTAYLLARAGKSVVVLDDGPIGGGMTGRTTAHLVNALDDRYFELERLHGEEGALLAAESHTAAIDKVEDIVREETIKC